MYNFRKVISMENTDKRQIKQIDGYKVNHPYTLANLIYGLFALILAAVPCVMLFEPMIVADGIQVIGKDYVDYIFSGFKVDLGSPLNELLSHCSDAPLLSQTLPILIMVQSCLWLVLAFLAIFGIILFGITISKGYLRNAKSVKTLSSFTFTFSLLFALTFLVIYILQIMETKACSWFIWSPFVLSGAILVLKIIINASYAINFKDCIQEDDLEFHSNDEDTVVTHVTQVHELTKVKYTPSTELPRDLKSIGGHEFSENQNLLIASIPNGITSIGSSAFANCLNLKIVNIPSSVTEIGYNCFFNCASLERLNYAGTKEEWRKITRGSNWLAKAKTSEVICADGILVVNPNR